MTPIMNQESEGVPPSPPPTPKKRAPKKKPEVVKQEPLAVKKVEAPTLKKKGYESCLKRCREDIKKIEYTKNTTLKQIPFGRLKEAYLQIYCANDQLQHDMLDVKGKEAKSIVKGFADASYKLNTLLQKSIEFCEKEADKSQ